MLLLLSSIKSFVSSYDIRFVKLEPLILPKYLPGYQPSLSDITTDDAADGIDGGLVCVWVSLSRSVPSPVIVLFIIPSILPIIKINS